MEVTNSVEMARSAKSAMPAAVEMYNKTVFVYREEVFCLLMVNAWEILAKARIIQQAGDNLEAIYKPTKNGRPATSRHTETPLTINLHKAPTRAGVTQNVRTNVELLSDIRNDVAHIGSLSPELKQRIGELGTASVHNFVQLLKKWFDEPVDNLYMLPVGFLGTAVGVPTSSDQRQRDLLKRLTDIAAASDPEYPHPVALRVHMNISPARGGGATIGRTSDPNAPAVRLTDDQILDLYSTSHGEIVDACKDRYMDFIQSSKFNDLMKSVKRNAECAYERRHNLKRKGGSGSFLFNKEAVIKLLDRHYTVKNS